MVWARMAVVPGGTTCPHVVTDMVPPAMLSATKLTSITMESTERDMIFPPCLDLLRLFRFAAGQWPWRSSNALSTRPSTVLITPPLPTSSSTSQSPRQRALCLPQRSLGKQRGWTDEAPAHDPGGSKDPPSANRLTDAPMPGLIPSTERAMTVLVIMGLLVAGIVFDNWPRRAG